MVENHIYEQQKGYKQPMDETVSIDSWFINGKAVLDLLSHESLGVFSMEFKYKIVQFSQLPGLQKDYTPPT